ncbi:MAG: EamA family transporter RarD [Opitutus sp.]|nr:EamA family transporter RarD [Opitutus sp.]
MAVSNSSAVSAAQAKTGAFAALVCYLLWGIVPLYWTQLAAVHPLELIAHRNLWSLLFVLLLVALQGGMGEIRAALSRRGSIAINFASGALLTTNWLIYVWGVNTGHVIECGLGYFFVPLVNVAVGRFLLHEQLRRLQWIAIAFAAGGVAWLIIQLGHAPWIALGLAASWSAYSLLRKRSPLGSLVGLTVETVLISPLALTFLVGLYVTGSGFFGRADLRTNLLIMSSGVITAIPLLLFAFGARCIRMSTLGLLQYVAPTVQIVLGLLVYHEPFSRERAESFGLIWFGLVLYTVDSLLLQRRSGLIPRESPS